MLFKLSIKNMKKSVQDYAIYFLTLVLGVAIFYVFNSLDSQKAILELSESTREIVDLLMTMLGGVSVFVSFILGFLIIYANNFLIKRRKREFGIYMTLGMGKGQISKILVTETLIIGIISLGVGLILGVFASQFMSIFVAKMFEADMSAYTFVFSSKAMMNTIIYFGIMYLLVLLFNTVTISRYKLIDLITAIKQNERIKMKNLMVAVITFLISICMLAYAYYSVTVKYMDLDEHKLIIMIIIGCIATFLFFWSLSGFLLKILQGYKKFYLKNLNAFVIRQMHNKINTTVFSMTIICLMLFITIVVLSTGVSLNQSFSESLQKSTPRDVCFESMIDGDEKTHKSVKDLLKINNFDMSLFNSNYVEATTYETGKLTLRDSFKNVVQEVESEFPLLHWDSKETVIGISEYNKMASYYGLDTYELKDNEYIVLCTFETIKTLRDKGLEESPIITLNKKKYYPKYKKCQEGYLNMSQSNTNFGIIVLPDEVIKEDKTFVKVSNFLAADYNASSSEEKAKIEKQVSELGKKNMNYCLVTTKISLYEGSRGLTAIATFIAIYLGIIFLISSAALLALKELSESADNRERYEILRKIGTDQKMIHKALFTQIGIFFLIPLLLAVVHSIFGIMFANKMLVVFVGSSLLNSILITAVVIIVIYGGYFMATYLESKKIIRS